MPEKQAQDNWKRPLSITRQHIEFNHFTFSFLFQQSNSACPIAHIYAVRFRLKDSHPSFIHRYADTSWWQVFLRWTVHEGAMPDLRNAIARRPSDVGLAF